MLTSMKTRKVAVSYVLVISLFGGFFWAETSREDKAQAFPIGWFIPTSNLTGPMGAIGFMITFYPFLMQLMPRYKPQTPGTVADAPFPLMYYIANCALHKGGQYATAHATDWTVERWMDQISTDCLWADDATGNYGGESYLAHDPFSTAGDGDSLDAVARTFCKRKTNMTLEASDRSGEPVDKVCIGTFGVNVVPDHYQFVVYKGGKVEWAIHRGAYELYPDYPLIGSGTGYTPSW